MRLLDPLIDPAARIAEPTRNGHRAQRPPSGAAAPLGKPLPVRVYSAGSASASPLSGSGVSRTATAAMTEAKTPNRASA